MTASVRQPVVWVKSPVKQEEENARLAREKSAMIVKVQVPFIEDGEVSVYREGRKGLKHQALTVEEQAMLGDDRKAHFKALWNVDAVRWDLLKRVKDQAW